MKFSFRDRKKAFSFGKNFHLCGLRQLLLSDVQSFFHVQHIFSTHCCIQLHQICLFYMELRGQKPVCQFSIIGKDKKSFRILIKPPHRKQIFCQKRHFPFTRKTTAAHGIQNRLFSRILCGRHDSGRLMKKKILVLLPADSLSFHLNDILCEHLISSIFDHSILNFYQSGCHLLFNLTSRPFGMIG